MGQSEVDRLTFICALFVALTSLQIRRLWEALRLLSHVRDGSTVIAETSDHPPCTCKIVKIQQRRSQWPGQNNSKCRRSIAARYEQNEAHVEDPTEFMEYMHMKAAVLLVSFATVGRNRKEPCASSHTPHQYTFWGRRDSTDRADSTDGTDGPFQISGIYTFWIQLKHF
ncbi:hypothetical protein DFH29DRAFT_496611 [Suillus ampliporus]|nr:hypothetical protein DFH29DRAFT_496611 [Suillus ampliporus]